LGRTKQKKGTHAPALDPGKGQTTDKGAQPRTSQKGWARGPAGPPSSGHPGRKGGRGNGGLGETLRPCYNQGAPVKFGPPATAGIFHRGLEKNLSGAWRIPNQSPCDVLGPERGIPKAQRLCGATNSFQHRGPGRYPVSPGGAGFPGGVGVGGTGGPGVERGPRPGEDPRTPVRSSFRSKKPHRAPGKGRSCRQRGEPNRRKNFVAKTNPEFGAFGPGHAGGGPPRFSSRGRGGESFGGP